MNQSKKPKQEKQLSITQMNSNYFSVRSGDNTYTVCVDYPEEMNEDVRVFTCTCPASKYSDKPCKHINAVIAEIDRLDNTYDDMQADAAWLGHTY